MFRALQNIQAFNLRIKEIIPWMHQKKKKKKRRVSLLCIATSEYKSLKHFL